MSFATYKKRIDDGDTVILYFGFDNMHQIRIQRGNVHQSKYGALKHDDMIGKPFGMKVHCSKGWLYVLYPTPELWTLTLPHRTQILYSSDISMVTLQLDLKPGSVVIESGTGSASLSHALIRTIQPTGHLYTFEFHEERCKTAMQEFESHGIGSNVTCSHRDVCANGFDMENVADAVFLDLPSPWLVIPFAKKALKSQGGRICSFSPCIEQVQRVCETLKNERFCEITTLECLTRPFDVRTINLPLPDLGWGPGKCVQSENFGGSYHLPVIGKLETSCQSPLPMHERKDESSIEVKCDVADDVKTEHKLHDSEPTAKKQRTGSRGGKRRQPKERDASSAPSFVFKTGLPPTQMPGHTGYLTFASLYPR